MIVLSKYTLLIIRFWLLALVLMNNVDSYMILCYFLHSVTGSPEQGYSFRTNIVSLPQGSARLAGVMVAHMIAQCGVGPQCFTSWTVGQILGQQLRPTVNDVTNSSRRWQIQQVSLFVSNIMRWRKNMRVGTVLIDLLVGNGLELSMFAMTMFYRKFNIEEIEYLPPIPCCMDLKTFTTVLLFNTTGSGKN